MEKRGRGRPRKIISDNLVEPTEKSDEEVAYSDKLPEFFKVYTHAISAESLKIPPDFIKKFGENIPSIVTLRGQSGHSWEVGVKRINENWFFQEGWTEFVQENLLEDDDFLTFCYSGNSIFCVKIFTRNGCVKRGDCIHGKPIENLRGNEASESGNCKKNPATLRNLSQKTSITKKSMRKNPSFSAVLSRSYIRKGCLHVPKDFARLYMTKPKGEPRMVTLWIGKNSWEVGLIFQFDRIQFSRGWPKFVKDNSLRNGNSCTFQLVDRNVLAFKVIVNR